MAQQSSAEAYDPSKDPLRKAKSPDPGWKYGFWPDLSKKDMIECTLCNKKVHGGIRRVKMHLTGGYPEVTKCKNTTTAIIKEMRAAIEKGKRKAYVPLDDEDDDDDDRNHEAPPNETSTAASRAVESSIGSSKRKRMTTCFILPQLKPTQTIASKLRKPPEEVVEERHSKGPSQTTLEYSTKTEEEKDRVKMHIANFFYENGIPFNAAHSRSYEIMIESIGQFGPGLKSPSYHEWVNGDVVDPGDALWLAVDTALDASEGLKDLRNARRGGFRASDSSSQGNVSSDAEMEENNDYAILNDDEDVDDDYGRPTTSNHESSDRETNEDIELDENI